MNPNNNCSLKNSIRSNEMSFLKKTQGLGLTVKSHCSSEKMDKSGKGRVGVKTQ